MEEENEVNLKLVIPLESYQKIMAYTQGVDTEITQFANITLNEETGELRLGEIFLLKQEAAGAHVDMEEDDIAEFMLECIKKGMTQLPQCWIHSHVNMAAFFSGTDVDTYTKTLNNGNWSVALVVNKRQEMKAVFQQYKPFLHTWDLEIEIDYQLPEIPTAIKKEIAKKVKEKTYTQTVGKKNTTNSAQTKIITKVEEGYGEPKSAYYSGKAKNQVLWLSKNRQEAINKINKLGLGKVWDDETLEWKFIDFVEGKEYIDYWKVVQNYSPSLSDWKN